MKACANCKWWTKLSIHIGECHNCHVVLNGDSLENLPVDKDVFRIINIRRHCGSLLTRSSHSCKLFDWGPFDRSESNFSYKKYVIFLLTIQVLTGLIIGIVGAVYSYFNNHYSFNISDKLSSILFLMIIMPATTFFSLTYAYLLGFIFVPYKVFLHKFFKSLFDCFYEIMFVPGGPRDNFSFLGYIIIAVFSFFVIIIFNGFAYLNFLCFKYLHIF